MNPPGFPALLQRFFTERLIMHQGASAHTVAAYRDTFRLLLPFVQARLGRAPSTLRMEDLDATCLEAFLVHLERDRGNHPRTRNQRLSALHGFFRFVALSEPALSLHCQRNAASSRFALPRSMRLGRVGAPTRHKRGRGILPLMPRAA